MKTKKALGVVLTVVLGALATPTLFGCGGVVQVGGGTGGSGGEGGDDNSGGAGQGGNTGSGLDGIAMTQAQLDASQSGGSGVTVGASGGGGPDPNTQILRFGGGTEEPACDAPYGTGGCGGWSVSVRIAPDLFHPGVIPFSDDGLDITFTESFDGGAGQCSGGGGGGFVDGELEILSITPTEVEFIVSGVTGFFEHDPNGERIVFRCP